MVNIDKKSPIVSIRNDPQIMNLDPYNKPTSGTSLVDNSIIDLDSRNHELMAALEEFLTKYKEQQKFQTLPLTVFKDKKLGVLEVAVKYLKENTNLSYNQIAAILNRDERTVWTSYNKAIKKSKTHAKHSLSDEASVKIDVKIFSDRSKSPLEALVKHLRARGMTIKQISSEISRDYKTIWTTNRK